MLEVEVKLKANIDELWPKLNALGFLASAPIYEKDIYFNSGQNDLKASDKALRIREYKESDCDETVFLLNFKGPKVDEKTMTRQETEFMIPSFKDGYTLLSGLGFEPAGQVEKTREYFHKGNITVCLDRVTNLGEFVEVEILTEDLQQRGIGGQLTDTGLVVNQSTETGLVADRSDSPYRKALAQIEDLLLTLGLSMDDTIRESYLCMLQKESD